TEIYTLSLHDALPIFPLACSQVQPPLGFGTSDRASPGGRSVFPPRLLSRLPSPCRNKSRRNARALLRRTTSPGDASSSPRATALPSHPRQLVAVFREPYP